MEPEDMISQHLGDLLIAPSCGHVIRRWNAPFLSILSDTQIRSSVPKMRRICGPLGLKWLDPHPNDPGQGAAFTGQRSSIVCITDTTQPTAQGKQRPYIDFLQKGLAVASGGAYPFGRGNSQWFWHTDDNITILFGWCSYFLKTLSSSLSQCIYHISISVCTHPEVDQMRSKHPHSNPKYSKSPYRSI